LAKPWCGLSTTYLPDKFDKKALILFHPTFFFFFFGGKYNLPNSNELVVFKDSFQVILLASTD
jgi:hypothetical protein